MSHVNDLLHYHISIFTLIGLKLQTFNPTPVRGCFLPPYRKMAITFWKRTPRIVVDS